MKYKHIPVMLEEVIEHLHPKKDEFFIDCTLGGGGYTFAISKLVGQNGGVLSFDLDEFAINNAKEIIKSNKINNVILANTNFKNLKDVVKKEYSSKKKFDGIVLDLGMSSAQLDDKERGFSFHANKNLNMSFAKEDYCKVEYILNNYHEREILRIFRELGEEKFSYNIVKNIIKKREKEIIKTPKQLLQIIEDSIPTKEKILYRDRIASRIFQALRIETNDELNNLKILLPQAVSLLKKGGRLIVVSFHRLEDKIVKDFFKTESIDCLCPPNIPICKCNHKAKIKIKYFKNKNKKQKFLKPKQKETNKNKRSESAVMRVAIKL